jgi:hypothetical protein
MTRSSCHGRHSGRRRLNRSFRRSPRTSRHVLPDRSSRQFNALNIFFDAERTSSPSAGSTQGRLISSPDPRAASSESDAPIERVLPFQDGSAG